MYDFRKGECIILRHIDKFRDVESALFIDRIGTRRLIPVRENVPSVTRGVDHTHLA